MQILRKFRKRILKQNVLRPEDEALTQIGTIHAFCSRLLRQYGPRVGLDPAYTIFPEIDAVIERDKLIKNYLIKQLNNKDSLVTDFTERFGFTKLNTLYQKLLSEPQLFIERKELQTHSEDEKLLIADLKKLYHSWLEQKIKKKTITFDDLEYLTVRVLQENSQIKQKINDLFGSLLRKGI